MTAGWMALVALAYAASVLAAYRLGFQSGCEAITRRLEEFDP
jgi:hypothetical protein